MTMADWNSVQVVDGEGNFNSSSLEAFCKEVKLSECGLSYAVVSIMGPQSSGKSTLLNHLFQTRFREMNAFVGRSQTTQGIWMAKALDISPCTIICDLEGTDGRERGEDDTTFEKQSSLFALAISDVVLVNMWCHDIGREQAANKPLLKTVFQVMMRLFSPRKTTLLFVIRDKTRTPLEALEPILRQDIQKIWDSVNKPKQFSATPLSDFFNIEVTALSNYEEKEEKFLEEVSCLRERFQNSISMGGIAGDRRMAVPGTGFPISIQHMWRVIKENKDLDLPAHKIMVATVRCEEIVREKISELSKSESWLALEEGARSGMVSKFGKQAAAILKSFLTLYDSEAAYFDESVRTAKRQYMLSLAKEILQGAYFAAVESHRAAAMDRFKSLLTAPAQTSFVELSQTLCTEAAQNFQDGIADCEVSDLHWDTSNLLSAFLKDLHSHSDTLRAERIKSAFSSLLAQFSESLQEPLSELLESSEPETWPRIRKLYRREVESVSGSLQAAMADFGLSQEEQRGMSTELDRSGKATVERKTREAAKNAPMLMKDRFATVFSRDADGLPRRWTGSEDIRSITKDARRAALRLLAAVAAVRLEEPCQAGFDADLAQYLGEGGKPELDGARETNGSDSPRLGRLRSVSGNRWHQVSAESTVLFPAQCRSLWRQFRDETEYSISQAMQAQEVSRRSNSWLPPPWAMLAMFVLGFNELMAVVRNPLILLVLVVIYFLGRALWVQLDVANDFQNGLLPGMLATCAKLAPTLMRLLKKLIEEGQGSNLHSTEGVAGEEAMDDFVSEGGSEEESYSRNGGPNGEGLRARAVRNGAISGQ